jgi:hypothetical protein
MNTADLKELIPEFYDGDGGWLCNNDHLELGITQKGQRVSASLLVPLYHC